MAPTARPSIYHIVHVDRLSSIVADGCLWSDASLQRRALPGTVIGMRTIKQRRLTNPIECRPGLKVGDCVPFYFCQRSVMLYVIHRANNDQLDYRGGQDPIVHLVADLNETVEWAEQNERRWAFTLSNAGSGYFEDRCDLVQLDEIDWSAVRARDWRACKEEKQAEFLLETSFPWTLVRHVGVRNVETRSMAVEAIGEAVHQPSVTIQRAWYY